MLERFSTKQKLLGLVISILVFGGYLAGLIAQILNPKLSGAITGYDWAGNPIIEKGFTFNPFKCWIYSFTTSEGLPIFFVLTLLVATIIMFKIFSKDGKDRDDERNFRISDKGLYGTSGWMTEEELKAILECKDINDTTGTILGIHPKTGKIVSLPTNAKINKHTAIYGASGTGKSRCFVRPQILQCVARGESIIITDPKGEIYADTAEFMRKRGYDVKMFNLVDPTYSDSWNCLAEITSNPDQIELMSQTFVEVIIKNTSEGGGGDHFWDNAEMNLLKALSLLIAMDETRSENQKNIGAAYELLTNNDEKKLSAMFDRLPIGHPARAPYSIYKQAGDTVRGNVIIGLGARLQVFQSEIIRRITTYNEIDLEGPAKRKSAYFVIMSDQDSTLDFLSSLFFSFLFIRLVRYADVKGKNGACDVPVNFILDEFPNIGSIPDFTKKLSTIRSRDLRVAVIFQNIAQLQNRYPDGLWEEIVGNCDTQLFLGCTDQMTAKFISERTGEMTIEVGSEQIQKESITLIQEIPQYRETKSSGKRFVLTPDEVMRLPNSNCLIILRGQKVLKLNKFDFSNHPGAKQFEHTYVRDYVPQWRAGQQSKTFILEDEKDTEEEISENLYQDTNSKNNQPPNFGGPSGGSPLGNSSGQRPVRQRKSVTKVKLSEETEIVNENESINIENTASNNIINPIIPEQHSRRRVVTAIDLSKPDIESVPFEASIPVNQYKAGTVIDSKDDYMDIINKYTESDEPTKPAPSIIPRGPKMIAQPIVEPTAQPVVIGVNGKPQRQIVPKPSAQFNSTLPDDF
jgi:type IV secretion system protein VirD4